MIEDETQASKSVSDKNSKRIKSRIEIKKRSGRGIQAKENQGKNAFISY
jgi:hypothetical protein